jgi:O-antigen/teichoic acid export membrane protein
MSQPPNPAPRPTDPFSTDHVTRDVKGLFVRGSAVAIGTQGMRLVLNLGSMVVLGRLLAPADFGLVAMAMTMLGFVSLFKDIGLSMAAVQRETLTHEQSSALFWINALLSILLAVFCVVGSPLLVAFFHEPRLFEIVFAGALGLVFSGLAAQHQALLTRQMRFLRLALSQLVPAALGIISAVILAVEGAGYWALVSQLVIAPAATLAISVGLCPWRPARPKSADGLRDMLEFGGGMTGFRLVSYLAQNVDNLLIGRAWGPTELGFYSRAYSLFTLPSQMLTTPVAAAAIPALSRIVNDSRRYRETLHEILGKVVLLNTPGSVYMLVCADWLIEVVLGPQWQASGRIFMAFGAYAIIQPISIACNWAFIAEGKSTELFRIATVNAILFSAICYLCLPWGGFGVALGFLFGGIGLRMPLYVFYASQKTAISIREIARTAGIHLLLGAVLALSLIALRVWLPPLQAISGSLLFGVLTLVLTFGIWWIFPSGRKTLMTMHGLLGSLRG